MELDAVYQDELAYLKSLARDFSRAYPELEHFFSASAIDPGVERLLEGAAFLNARLRQKIDDEFPEITQALLSEVWPTPLQAVPATSVIEFTPDDSRETLHIHKGAQVKGKVDEQEYLFKTQRETTIHPLVLTDRKATHASDGSYITLSFEYHGLAKGNGYDEFRNIPIFLSRDRSTASLLLLWFNHYLTDITLNHHGVSQKVPSEIIAPHQPDERTLVLPSEIKQYWRLQLLQEYFYIPHAHDFINIDLRDILSLITADDTSSFTVTFRFSQTLPPECQINEDTFRLYCTPVINLFSTSSSPLTFATSLTHAKYKITPSNSHHHLFMVRKVYSPAEASDDHRGEIQCYRTMTDFMPVRFEDRNSQNYFYQIMLEKDIRDNPVYYLSFYDSQGKPTNITSRKHFVCELECLDDESILQLKTGDICIPTSDIPSGVTMCNITPLSRPLPPITTRHWPLISHLSLSPVLLNDKNVIQHVVSDFDIYAMNNLPAHEKHKRYLSGIEHAASKPIDRLVNGVPIRGIRFELSMNPDNYPNKGEMYRFGALLAQFFAYCVTDNSFLITSLIDIQTGERWNLPQISGSKQQI